MLKFVEVTWLNKSDRKINVFKSEHSLSQAGHQFHSKIDIIFTT